MGGLKKRKADKKLERRIAGYEAMMGKTKQGAEAYHKPGSKKK